MSIISERIHKIKSKYRHNDKKYQTFRSTHEICDCYLEYTDLEDVLIEYKCLCCNKNYQQTFDEKLKERFFNTHKSSNHDNNNFILLLWKGAYPY